MNINTINAAIDFPLEVYNHNDFGMATANAMAAIRGGAVSLVVSVGGLGDGTGNAAMEEIVMAMRYLEDLEMGIETSKFREIAEYVAKASARAIPIWKAIVGTNVFAHESGIHADGVIKNPKNYEAILHKFKEYDIELTDKEANDILAMTRTMSVDLKRPLFDKELMYIYKEYKSKKEEEPEPDESEE